jgi:hypothetical protein
MLYADNYSGDSCIWNAIRNHFGLTNKVRSVIDTQGPVFACSTLKFYIAKRYLSRSRQSRFYA